MAAGSRLGLAPHRDSSFPVGQVSFVDLHPLTFSDLAPRTILDGSRLFTEFKGALAEQYVLQELGSSAQSVGQLCLGAVVL